MTQLTYQLDRRFPIAVIRLTGDLTAGSGPYVRAAVSEALVAEPTSAIVDLSAVQAADELIARLLPQLATEATHWPGTELLLCGADPAVARVLQASSDGSGHPLYPTFDDALAAAALAPVPHRVHRRLESTVNAPREARELAADACAEWGVPDCVIATEIIASELVTNAVRHAGTMLDLRLTLRDRSLRISVQDRSSRMARLRTPTSSDDHGRGLLIVGSVATSWGSQPAAGGKVVWATLNIGGRSGRSRHQGQDSDTIGAEFGGPREV
ncbi:STAS domain-containing protein [Natronosporangium hydrolyticum]|uniref:STAS domain-containing protein n=1 Tax=Natronosporangium hydrolyticum TaxID=2811111 RepID=A0A895Y8U5_9ACTN|nr:STAS domain-containing protein [Natronosporangium hydrolyticum]QSB12735.1 STAS domain-containing protein [Natronosporangium hydrolyticum]